MGQILLRSTTQVRTGTENFRAKNDELVLATTENIVITVSKDAHEQYFKGLKPELRLQDDAQQMDSKTSSNSRFAEA
jgi:hypothetical protein